ncbi:MAG: GIY-YIG nuclease family protein [bacterium]|nr:GIY-YIG nuclease family protein [bacterium]
MYFVYLIQSQQDNSFYTGITENLKKRINEHNNGSSVYSATKRPFIPVWYCIFSNKQRALAFEKYLKSGSGIAFRNKHLI